MTKIKINIQIVINIFAFPLIPWAGFFATQGSVKLINELELHPPCVLYILLLAISVLIFINFIWISQRWKEFRERTSPKGKLRNLAKDIYRLSEMDIEQARKFSFDYSSNNYEDYDEFLEADTELFELANYVVKRLNSICDIELSRIVIYPKYFKAIRIFAERGDISEVKRISSDMSPYVYF